VFAHPVAAAPNTKIVIGGLTIVLNEQSAFSTPDNGLHVNSVRITVHGLLQSSTTVIVGSAESDISNCYTPAL
jgi:hypothetical protein